MIRRIRYEFARRLNRFRSGDRWTQAVVGGRQIVAFNDRMLELRPGTSDFMAFLEVFDCRHYDSRGFQQDALIQERYEAIVRSGQTPLIIDAGANIGMASLFFAERYPAALVLALEPEPANYAELVRHSARRSNIRPMLAAVAATDGFVGLVDPGLGAWGFRTGEGKDIPAHSLATLVEQSGAVPFILKIDIEGGEKGLFDKDVLGQFCAAFVEPHDWMLPGEGTFSSFLTAHLELQRDLLVSGQNLISVGR